MRNKLQTSQTPPQQVLKTALKQVLVAATRVVLK
jgi:hypothetical protein